MYAFVMCINGNMVDQIELLKRCIMYIVTESCISFNVMKGKHKIML